MGFPALGGVATEVGARAAGTIVGTDSRWARRATLDCPPSLGQRGRMNATRCRDRSGWAFHPASTTARATALPS